MNLINLSELMHMFLSEVSAVTSANKHPYIYARNNNLYTIMCLLESLLVLFYCMPGQISPILMNNVKLLYLNVDLPTS